MRAKLRALWCILNGGHFKMLHAKPERLCLKCVACGHETPGWEVRSVPRNAPPPSIRSSRSK